MKKSVLIIFALLCLSLVSCSGGGSSSGGGVDNRKGDCQVCVTNDDCQSGWCAGPYEKTNMYRCTPKNANPKTWRCPVNYAKSQVGGGEMEDTLSIASINPGIN